MTAHDRETTEEAQIGAALEDWAEATRAKDVDRIMAHCAPDILIFDCHSRFQVKGAEAHREFLEACFPHMRGPMTFEIHDLDIAVQGDAAFGHYLARTGATGLDGTEHGGWLRVTVCWRKARGRWLMVHAHVSAPFDPETGKTMFGREPEHVAPASAA